MTRSTFGYLPRLLWVVLFVTTSFSPMSAIAQPQTPERSKQAAASEAKQNTAIAEWRRLAESGDAEASQMLGHALLTGDGVAANPQEAVRWLQLAADKGNGMAQLTLGMIFDEGGPVPSDKSKAVAYYKKAAEQNIKEAQYNLGTSYATGDGVPKNLEEAASWYLKAAENWDPSAQLQLGLAFLGGKGVKASREDAIKWLRRSAYQANSDAQFQLGVLVHQEAGASASEEAVKWLERAADSSHSDAMAYLGALYARGDGVPKRPEKALEHLSNAAKLGHPRAEYELGLCFMNGEGVVQNDSQAFYWFQLSAIHGDPDAQFRTGMMLAKGRGTPADKELSARWLRIAASQGNASALAQLQQGSHPPADASQMVVAPSESMPPMVSVNVSTNLPIIPSSPLPPTTTSPVTRSDTASSNGSPEKTETRPSTAAGPGLVPQSQTSDPTFRNLVIFAAFAPAFILALMVYILWTVAKERLKSLESEVKETKNQLQKANENLEAVLRLVESKMTLARSPALKAPLHDPIRGPKAQIQEHAEDPGPFKIQRPAKPPQERRSGQDRRQAN